ncbi:putative ATP-dependent endonuclease of OLD family [Filimonas zeae]|uniref:ATPase AAA-type core domain-containing protein n=1 Tax=Filimonas zeae TaxID=1737353 RepID=A0A917J0Y3_9BACT|nr:AAA family ATPase [Filimonas zeae]MDR6340223.1 putative ATP-dependent endonuclease of OLD family [Filimonas zeae]GGH71728.1 hypothetical protein GCM10011379_31380 [Filimonas zeae]
MHIKSLQLNNFRCFTEAHLDFSKGINIITGVNNSGKSSIIKAIYRLQQEYSIDQSDIRINESYLEILLNIKDISVEDHATFSHTKQMLNSKTEHAYVKFSISIFGSSSSMITEQETQSPLTLKDYNSVNNNERPFTREFISLPNSEEKQNLFYPFFAKRKRNYSGTQFGKTNTFAIYEDFQNLAAKVLKTSNNYRFREKFQTLCKELMGFDIAIIPGENNESKLGIYAGNNKTIPIESMGEGVINILGLIIILLTEEGKVFLIEELENDLHPQVLKKLLNLIVEKSARNQFIISTHSNITLKYLGSVPDSKIFCIEAIEHNDQFHNLNTSVIKAIDNSVSERKKVLELLGYDFHDFEMYSAYIIFEESTAERFFREYLIPFYFPNLKGKIRTIASQGAADVESKFKDLNNLFLFLHTSSIYENRVWVITDGDSAGLNAIEKLKERYKSWNPEHFINLKNNCLEDYYPSPFQNHIDKIRAEKDRLKRQTKKGELVEKVLEWLTNPDSEKSEYKQKISEFIEIIANISESLEQQRTQKPKL